MYSTFISFILFFALTSVYADLISTNRGSLEGVTLTARHGKLFNAYFGIPFAEPPVGKLRLQPPIEVKPWTGTILNATTAAPACVQIDNNSAYKTIIGAEDCLYLNVYTPLRVKKGDNFPVIFSIYGGAFKRSSNMFNGPQYIMQRDIIVVQANYRGGVLGFLSTGDTVISGNFGLKDQTLALKWVHENIDAFGGDPNQITLQGHSSGSVCAHLHTLSPLSEGLFHRVIIQSGTGYCPMGHSGADVAKNVAKEFAERAGCNANSSQEMLSCFLELKPEVFLLIDDQMNNPTPAFKPTVEDKNVIGAFLTEDPYKALYPSTEQPWIIGMTTAEAAFGPVPEYLSDNGKLLKEINDKFETMFPITLQYLWNTKRENLDYVSRQIRNRYFKNEEINTTSKTALLDMYTHGLYGICTIEAIKKYPGKKYVYFFDQVTSYSKLNKSDEEYLGVGHADEVELIFSRKKSAKYLNETDIIIGDEMITRWTNFAYSSDPNQPLSINENIFSTWKPMQSERIEYLRMKLNGSMETDLYKGIYDFWKSLSIGNKYY